MEATDSEKITNYESADLSRITSFSVTTILAVECLSTGCALFADLALLTTDERHGGEKRRAVPLLGNELLHGLAPPKAEVGGWVVCLWVCDVAVVMRKVASETGCQRHRDDAAYYILIDRADVAGVK
ncbi:hypothetical protein DL770_003068 [Monosporascus sp. CRB-9-2]|nr:hypothetical protein DL770_003068 [Monosporascus sp. CRB-9-2]